MRWKRGAQFIVSPGLTEPLARAAINRQVPFLPGTANAGDIMRGLDLGLTHFKFFPAMAAGGLPALEGSGRPVRPVPFSALPAGSGRTMRAEWLAFDPVLCVGGSWGRPQGGAGLRCYRRNGAQGGEAGRMKTIAEMVDRLRELHRQTQETPLFNPVFQLGLDLSRSLESGDLTLDAVENLIADLECEAMQGPRQSPAPPGRAGRSGMQ